MGSRIFRITEDQQKLAEIARAKERSEFELPQKQREVELEIERKKEEAVILLHRQEP